MKKIFSEERRRAWDEVLFWARRLSYKAADYHPEWRQKYEEAKQRLNEIKAAEARGKNETKFSRS